MKPRILIAFFCCLASISMVRAETVSVIFSNGDPANRIDIVVLAEGYTSAESEKFNSDANTLINSFFNVGILTDYKSYFNVQSIFVASLESGATHLESTPAVVKNTAFGAYYGCSGIDRLICVDYEKVNLAVSAVLAANQSDYIFVLVNDPVYGGSGGYISVSSTHEESVEVMLHEFGHSHGLLADEYAYSPPACGLYEPSAANATMQTARDQIKWSSWIADSTAIPTTNFEAGVPGLYEGAVYCESGMYRPTFESKMRSLGFPFEQINDEQMVRRFYNLVSPIDSAIPLEASVSVPMGTTISFSVVPLQPVEHSLSTSWYVDEILVASGNDFTLNTGTLTMASHSVSTIVRDETTWVRTDPYNLTWELQTWTVVVTTAPVTLSSSQVLFGSVNVTDEKASSPAITLTNSGSQLLTISNITLTGTDAAQFSVATTCGALPVQIAAGGNCTIDPSFKPTSTGAKSASVSISSDAAGAPHSIGLSGTGADFAIDGSQPVTVDAGQAAIFTINLTTTASPTVSATTFTATGNPAGSTVSFEPQSIPADSATGSTVLTVGTTMQTAVITASLDQHAPLWPLTLTLFGTMVLVTTSAGAAGKGTEKTKHGYATYGIVAVLMLVIALVIGCSDKGSDTSGSPPGQDTTGEYTITVTATSGSVSRTTQVMLMINP